MFSKKDKVIQIPVNSICPNPYQPRTVFGQEEIERLAMSIRENGLLQPVAVRDKKNGEYELIAGERRLRATRYLGQTTISAIVVDTSSQQSAILALLENIQRQNLDFFEEAEAYYRLMQQWNMSQTQIAQKIGISQSAFANKIRLLQLSDDIKKQIRKYGLTSRHARALLKLSTEEARRKALKRVIEGQLNVSQTEDMIERMGQEKKVRKKPAFAIKDVRIFYNTIARAIKTMQLSGVEARADKRETDQYVEYVVRIAKT